MFKLFLIFQEKSFRIPEKVNEEVSSNKKYEVATMIVAAPKLSYAVSKYASDHVRSIVQFYAIEKLCMK